MLWLPAPASARRFDQDGLRRGGWHAQPCNDGESFASHKIVDAATAPDIDDSNAAHRSPNTPPKPERCRGRLRNLRILFLDGAAR